VVALLAAAWVGCESGGGGGNNTGGGTTTPASTIPNVAGTWEVEIVPIGGNEVSGSMMLNQSGGNLSGTSVFGEVSGWVNDSSAVELYMTSPFSPGASITLRGTVSSGAKKMSGIVISGGDDIGTWEATK
jgi:hypothetical protein